MAARFWLSVGRRSTVSSLPLRCNLPAKSLLGPKSFEPQVNSHDFRANISVPIPCRGFPRARFACCRRDAPALRSFYRTRGMTRSASGLTSSHFGRASVAGPVSRAPRLRGALLLRICFASDRMNDQHRSDRGRRGGRPDEGRAIRRSVPRAGRGRPSRVVR